MTKKQTKKAFDWVLFFSFFPIVADEALAHFADYEILLGHWAKYIYAGLVVIRLIPGAITLWNKHKDSK